MIDFSQPADVVAPQLLGCIITANGVSIRLTEVEAYLADDPASHTYNGKTPRNQAMFGPPGRLYVYISYGIHRAGNLVCNREGIGEACLMRAGEVVTGIELAQARRGGVSIEKLACGPGNLGRALGLDLEQNGLPVHIAAREEEPEWVRGRRIGISKNVYAPLRFWIPGHPTVSARRWPEGGGR